MGTSAIIMIIRKFWPYMLLAGVLIGIFLYWSNLQSTISQLTADKQTLTQERDIWKGNYDSLSVALTEQKQILQTVASQTETLKGDFSALQGNIKFQVGAISGSLKNINKVDLSKLSCEQAIDYLRQSAKTIPTKPKTLIPKLSPADVKELQK